MHPTHKKLFGQPKSQLGPLARTLSVSLYPSHRELLARRERELNIHRSILLQLLLDVEEREGLLRREITDRLRRPVQLNPNPRKEHSE